jgi:hypothetical protein
MSWKTTRLINNTAFTNKINKVLFIVNENFIYNYNEELKINKYKQDGNFDINNGTFITAMPLKIMIEINLQYNYDISMEYAPRYELNIYKNNILLTKHYCGLSDNIHTVNSLYIVSIIDILNNDKIKFIITQSTPDSILNVNILKNTFINFKTI